MALIPQALTTRARAKSFLGIGRDSYDSLIDILINIATSAIEKYCERSFLRQTYTNEELDGPGSNTIVLPEYPVASITQIQERTTDEPDVDSWQTIDDKEYFWYEDGRVIKRSGNWLNCPQRYRITYAAGYLIAFASEDDDDLHTLPHELEYACLKLVAAMFNTRKMEGFSSQRVGDQSADRADILDHPDIVAILDKYAG